jgi:hypothetical protein
VPLSLYAKYFNLRKPDSGPAGVVGRTQHRTEVMCTRRPDCSAQGNLHGTVIVTASASPGPGLGRLTCRAEPQTRLSGVT